MSAECEGETVAAPAVVARLIERATNSTAGKVDPRLMKAIKYAVRSSDDEVRLAVHALMDEMKKQHAQVRYLAVQIIDELFMRSKLFRSLLVVNLDQFLSLSVGFRRNLPLPPPSSIASMLRSKSIELLEKWNASFGVHYRQLRLGFDYLKNNLRYQFPNRLENAARLQQERRERELRSKQILLGKFENLKENYDLIKSEIQSTIDEITECIDMLRPKEEDSIHGTPAEDDEVDEFQSLTLRQIRLDSLREGEKVRESNDNKAIFDALRESYKLLITKHLQSVQEWISVLVKVDLTDNKFRDTALKQFIDTRNHIQSVKKRCTQFSGLLDDTSAQQEEEDFWEEGTLEVEVAGFSSALNKSHEASVTALSAPKDKHRIRDGDNKSSDEQASCSTSERSRLLSEAPVMTWGPFLDNWGAPCDAMANQRGLELEGHWGRVDYDAVIPAEKIAELNVHRTVYKEEPVEIQPCHAPLKKGGLCQRRDLRVCPFHGPIIPRDAEGNPLVKDQSKQEPEDESSTQVSDPVMDSVETESLLNLEKPTVEQLAKQALKNVREREKDVRSLKRAKLARIREHNEVVLREAALASTSYSEALGDHGDESHHLRTDARVKQTLASMLRKKVTVKDRLAQRLLSNRATDASTREFTQGEDSRYREAFPNQW